jgi:hypothetical protein
MKDGGAAEIDDRREGRGCEMERRWMEVRDGMVGLTRWLLSM